VRLLAFRSGATKRNDAALRDSVEAFRAYKQRASVTDNWAASLLESLIREYALDERDSRATQSLNNVPESAFEE
jgi:hypothetical protein